MICCFKIILFDRFIKKYQVQSKIVIHQTIKLNFIKYSDTILQLQTFTLKLDMPKGNDDGRYSIVVPWINLYFIFNNYIVYILCGKRFKTNLIGLFYYKFLNLLSNHLLSYSKNIFVRISKIKLIIIYNIFKLKTISASE